MKKILGFIKISSTILVFTVLIILILDSILGIFAHKINKRSITLKELKPYSVFFHKNVENRIGKNGELPEKKIIKENTILFFGGSTTENRYIEANKRFSEIVEKNLKKKYTVLNFATSGAHSMHSNLSFQAKGIKFKPKFAIMKHNINDLNHLLKYESYFTNKSSHNLIKEENKSFLFKVKDLFFSNIYNFILSKSLKFSKIIDKIYYKSVSKVNLNDKKKININSIKEEFKSSLEMFVKICETWKIEPILMTQAKNFNDNFSNTDEWRQSYISKKVSWNEYSQIFNEFNEIIRDLAQINGIILVDLDENLSLNEDNFIDHIHLNEKGNLEASKLLFKILK